LTARKNSVSGAIQRYIIETTVVVEPSLFSLVHLLLRHSPPAVAVHALDVLSLSEQ